MAKAVQKETPLMKQYNQIKAKYPGALLLFRVGDFYETFGEDAVKASRILDIVLTKRANGAASHIELAGFPHHALDSYLPRLVRAGNRVAICDQLEDPRQVKGIVKRGVTELVTPGLSYHDTILEQKSNNYLASVFIDKDINGVAFLDLSTGEFLSTIGDLSYISNLIQSFRPSECIYCRKNRQNVTDILADFTNTFCQEDWIYAYDFAYEKLTRHFKTNNLKGFGIEDLPEAIIASGAILHYLEETEHHETKHINAISRIEGDKYVWLDRFTIRNLELVRPQNEGGVPLIEILDKTVTPMGGRLLKKWMLMPLKNINEIKRRHQFVNRFFNDEDLAEKSRELLKQIGDLERLVSKVSTGRINPREMLQLRRSLSRLQPLKELIGMVDDTHFSAIAERINPCTNLYDEISGSLKDELPIHVNQGNLIRDGVNEELDELRKIAFSGKDYLLQIQQRESNRTGIPSLKIAYNKVFGYYLEVTNTHKDKVPGDWIRKQTLVNAERYITEELKEYETKILQAEEKLVVIEYNLYQELVLFASEYMVQIQENARIIAELDCLLSFAEVSKTNKYAQPEITETKNLFIKDGRHPVIEKQLPLGEKYVPNDLYLNDNHQQILIITGPNMAGKSALLRQTALIVLMAQIGCFVPATQAEIGIVDKIFTRVGASDNLSRGESTFMVEMTETASILNNLSERSLILMDEIGRGTSTYDGVSIAWSIIEYLHNHPKVKAKTLFATHYHELNQLESDLKGIKNFNVSVKEIKGKIIFLRKLKEGGSEHSFGIHVAKLAGIPNQIVLRANDILHTLGQDKIRDEQKEKLKNIPQNSYQMSLFATDPRYEEVNKLINGIDINTISPVEALLKLSEIKNILSKT